MSGVIALREIGPESWPQFREIRLGALSEAPYGFGSTWAGWENADEARWRARLTDVAFNVLAVDAAGTAVGMVSGVEGDPVELISLISAGLGLVGGQARGAWMCGRIIGPLNHQTFSSA